MGHEQPERLTPQGVAFAGFAPGEPATLTLTDSDRSLVVSLTPQQVSELLQQMVSATAASSFEDPSLAVPLRVAATGMGMRQAPFGAAAEIVFDVAAVQLMVEIDAESLVDAVRRTTFVHLTPSGPAH